MNQPHMVAHHCIERIHEGVGLGTDIDSLSAATFWLHFLYHHPEYVQSLAKGLALEAPVPVAKEQFQPVLDNVPPQTFDRRN